MLILDRLLIFPCFPGLQSTGSADAARDVLVEGIKRVPHCKLLLEVFCPFSI
jgi:hypothetical protein